MVQGSTARARSECPPPACAPVSEPIAKSAWPAATAAAEPQEEPPGKRSGAAGFSGVPIHTFSPVMP